MAKKLARVASVPVRSFGDPVREALSNFQRRSNDAVLFDLEEAADFVLTPEKPNAARSISTVKHLGEAVGTLYVIAFAPYDGTGDENSRTLRDISVPVHYPPHPKVVPRDKTGVHSEMYLPIFGQHARASADPALHAGQLDALGLQADGMTIAPVLHLGQTQAAFMRAIDSGAEVWRPEIQFTVGYQGDKRYGDPHAIYNNYQVLQVAGFLAISQEAPEAHRAIANELQAQPPLLLTV